MSKGSERASKVVRNSGVGRLILVHGIVVILGLSRTGLVKSRIGWIRKSMIVMGEPGNDV